MFVCLQYPSVSSDCIFQAYNSKTKDLEEPPYEARSLKSKGKVKGYQNFLFNIFLPLLSRTYTIRYDAEQA